MVIPKRRCISFTCKRSNPRANTWCICLESVTCSLDSHDACYGLPNFRNLNLVVYVGKNTDLLGLGWIALGKGTHNTIAVFLYVDVFGIIA